MDGGSDESLRRNPGKHQCLKGKGNHNKGCSRGAGGGETPGDGGISEA